MALIYAPITVFILVLIHWMSQFIFQEWGTLPRFFLSFILSAGLLGVQLAIEVLSLGAVIAVVIWFIFLTELYVFIFTLSLGSISLKTLQLLRERPMTPVELEALYQPTSMVAIRFHRLATAGMIKREGEILTLTARGKYLLAVFTFIRGKMHASSLEDR